MPTSNLRQVSGIVEMIVAADPQSMLDVGVGFGKYGVLAREYLELLDGHALYDDRSRRIDGIEIFPDYLTDLHHAVYDRIMEGDAVEILPTLPNADYDLILLVDVLEHFPTQVGSVVLEECLRVGRNLIVSTPLHFFTQEGYGNPHEQHRSFWTKGDLLALERPCFFLPRHHSLCCFLGENALRVKTQVLSPRRRVQRSLGLLVQPLRRLRSLFVRPDHRRLES
jgi:hypothetical protein